MPVPFRTCLSGSLLFVQFCHFCVARLRSCDYVVLGEQAIQFFNDLLLLIVEANFIARGFVLLELDQASI